MRPSMTTSMLFPLTNQGRPGFLVAPGAPDPGVLRVVGRGHRTKRTGKGVQIIDVVAVGSDDRVISLGDENEVAIPHDHSFIDPPVRGVHPLNRVAFRAIDAVVVDLFEIDLAWRIPNVVLVGRITGPVAARRIDLADEQ